MTRLRWLAIALTAVLTLGLAPGQDRPKDKKDVPPEAAIMAVKLKHAEALVKAVTLQEFKKIDEIATALHKISRAAEFLNAYRTEEYQFQAMVFQRAALTMAERARQKNSDGVMLAYLDLTKSCLKCHQTFRGPIID